MPLPIALLALLLTFSLPSSAILAPPSSPCAVRCGNVLQSTSRADVACGDTAFGSQPGLTFQSCVECQLGSTYVESGSGGLSDLQAVIYNLRYTASYCIFNESTVASTPCITEFSCGHFLGALDYNGLAVPSGALDYGYCAAWDDSLLSRCQNCLRSLGQEQILNNYMTALSASCQQKPPNGKRLSIDGTPFSTVPINITDPTSLPTTAASTFTASTGLSLGAKIGIAIGALILLLILAGFTIVWRGKRRRRAVLAAYARRNAPMQEVPRWRQANDDSPQSMSSGAFMTKPSNYWASGSAGEGESPQSAIGAQAQQVWSPYVSQHTSPVSGETGARGQWPSVPIPRPYRRDSVGVLAGRVEGEGIEMSPLGEGDRWEREVGQAGFVSAPAPIIRQPGHGRAGSFGEAM